VVAHNGILRESAHPAKGDPRSDTRKFADEILPQQFKRLDRPGVRYALEQWLGGNKLVILTTDPRYQCYAYILNESAGTWDDATGLWHSNTDFKWPRYSRYSGKTRSYGSMWGYDSAWGGDYDWDTPYIGGRTPRSTAQPALTAKHRVSERITEDDVDDRCRWCQGGHVDRHGYCDVCLSCEDCSEHFQECLCYCEDEDVLKVAVWEREKAQAEAYDTERWGDGDVTIDLIKLDNGDWAGKAS
jgi:glutamine amidotransferase